MMARKVEFEARFSEKFKEELRFQVQKAIVELKNSDIKLMETKDEIHEALKNA